MGQVLRSFAMSSPKRLVPLFILIILATLLTTPAPAGDVQDLYQQANKELRQAQKDMFAGKNEAAVAALDKIRDLLARAKEADPNNPQVKSYQSKFTKLVKDLEKRTGKDLGGGSLTAAKSSSQGPAAPDKPQAKPLPEKAAQPAQPVKTAQPAKDTQAQPKAEAKAGDKLPYQARRPLQNAGTIPARIDSYIGRMADPNYTGDKNQLVANADKTLAQGREMLAEARKLAAEKGVSSHPDLDEVEAGLGAAEKRLAEAKAGLSQTQSQAAAQTSEVTADVKDLLEVYQKVDPVFRQAGGSVVHYNDLATVTKLVTAIEDFEKGDLGLVQQSLAAFSAKYGSTAGEIDKKTESLGYSGQNRAGYLFTSLEEGIANVAKTREVMADDLIRRAKQMQANASAGAHDFSRLEGHARIKEYGQMAARFQADNPRVQEFMGGLEAWIQKDRAALEAKIDQAAWPKQAADAPEDAKMLTGEAVSFLQKEADKQAAQGKEPRRIVAVVATGPWGIFKKNILGEIIQWGLPVYVAEQWQSEKDSNLVRAFNMTMLTQEYKGVKKAPPYLGAAVGDSYYLRLSAVK